MKKYIILSAVALLALGACSKVTPAAGDADQAITFQVANFASRTKANTSLIDEGYTSFNTYAWFYDENAGATEGQLFMNDEVVTADDTTTPTKWAPERTYYWPKTGYVNFYSYAGIFQDCAVTEKSLVVTDAIIIDPKESNILVAKPALKQSKNTNPATYGNSGATEGVPTLFNHMLAKIQFKVLLDATGLDENFTWEAKIAKNQTLLQIPARGKLSVSFADGGNVPTWTNIDGNSLLTSKDVTLTAAGNKKSSEAFLTAEDENDFFVVIPQVNKDLEFQMTFTLTSTYAGAAGITETVPVSFKLSEFSGANTEWIYNTKYIYTISIKPNGEVILFDPAVAEWTEDAGEIVVPTA